VLFCWNAPAIICRQIVGSLNIRSFGAGHFSHNINHDKRMRIDHVRFGNSVARNIDMTV
jgi:hypothetical protein